MTRYRRDHDALTGGHWVKKAAGLRIWVPNAKPAHVTPIKFWHVTGVSCTDCGCLLTHADELCPACVRPWMYAQEKAWSERPRVVYYRRREQVAA